MSDTGMPKQCTEEQWSRVQQVVHDQALKVRVAARFLPLFGPLPPGTATVPRQRVDERRTGGQAASDPLAIQESKVLDLITVSINVPLTTTQQSEPDLSSALTLFARAANIIARMEDAIIFQGHEAKEILPSEVSGWPLPKIDRLLKASDEPENTIPISSLPSAVELVQMVAKGVSVLDSQGYLSPYALVLGENLFLAGETPNPNLALPSDPIRRLIEGPLLRSGSLPPDKGVLVSLAGSPAEIVVASDVHVRFLQLTEQSRYLYRVSQRFVLRIKEPNAIVTLEPPGTTPTQLPPAPTLPSSATSTAASVASSPPPSSPVSSPTPAASATLVPTPARTAPEANETSGAAATTQNPLSSRQLTRKSRKINRVKKQKREGKHHSKEKRKERKISNGA